MSNFNKDKHKVVIIISSSNERYHELVKKVTFSLSECKSPEEEIKTIDLLIDFNTDEWVAYLTKMFWANSSKEEKELFIKALKR